MNVMAGTSLLGIRSADACDYATSSAASHTERLQTFAPGVFLDWSFGSVSGLGVGLRASYLSHGPTFGFGGFTQASWRRMGQIDATTWRIDAGALLAPMAVNRSDASSGCAVTSTLGGTGGGYAQIGGTLHGPTEVTGPTGSAMVGAYAWAAAYVGISGFFPFFGDDRRRGPEVSISLGIDVPVVVHRTLADGL